MGYSTFKSLHAIKQSFTLITSKSIYYKFKPLKTTLINSFQHVTHKNPPRLLCKLNLPTNFTHNFFLSGSKLNIGSIFGVSVIFGSIVFRPRVAYAMDGHDILVDDHHLDLFSNSDVVENPPAIWMFVRKFWLPAFFIVTVLVNWDHPIILATKVILFLLSTKPSPLSVYVFVEQFCQQYMRQESHWYRLKSLYANKVEVQDYKLLCIARVEVGDQKFTLVGILGGWWVLPLSQGVFSVFRNGALKQGY